MLNELKPEDVMMALKCCVTADHNLCPYRGDWSCDHTLVTNALALLREKDAEIERLRKAKCIYHTVDYCADDLAKAQEEIARLTKEFLGYQADVQMEIADARAKAVDEVKLRLAMRFGTYTDKDMTPIEDLFSLIDQIAEKMKEEQDGR